VMSVDNPLPTVTTANRGEMAIVEPFIVQPAHGTGGGRGDSCRVSSVDVPLGTQPASNRFGVVESFIITPGGPPLRQPRGVSEPLPTVMGGDRFAVVEAFVLQQQSGGMPRPVSEPAPTIAAKGAVSLVEPFLTKYNRTAVKGYSVEDPLDTVSTRDRFGLVQPVINGYALDIRFRMLQPHELSAAMSFPKAYVFTGNKGDQIRQIGNAVDCSVARALCGAILDGRRSESATKKRGAA